MIRVHHLNNSRSQRVLWLLEELALPYEIVQYHRDPKTMLAPESLRRIHPLGKSPIVEDGSRVLAETGAIVEYIIAKYGPHLAPDPSSELHWRYIYWLHYAEGSAMPPLLLKLLINRLGWLGRPARGFVDRQLNLHLDYQAKELATQPWFVGGQFTGADVMMSYPLEAATQRAGLTVSRPRLWDFLQRIHARPAYRKALERGGPYAFA
jgi:glutathione S-transferase